MGWFTAQHPGTCVLCGGDITPGQPIVRRDTGYAHAACPETPTESATNPAHERKATS